jgi:cytochrome c553
MRISKMSYRAAVFILLALLASACQGLAGEPRVVATIQPSAPVESSLGAEEDIAAVMAAGAQVWQENCIRCHGNMGEGTAEGAPLPDLTGMSDDRILASITNGVRDVMPAFAEDLSAEELIAAMTYAKMMSLAIARDMVQTSEGDDAEAAVVTDVVGAVVGQVSNGTAGGVLPEALALSLHVVQSGTSQETFETVMNADGSFQFADVPMGADYQYVVTTSYGDVTFVSDIVEGDSAQLSLTLPLTIYEAGADASAIVVEGISAQLFVRGETVHVVEIVQFANTSDRVFLSLGEGSTQSIGVRLPDGAQLQNTVNESQVVSSDGTRVYDNRPLHAGGAQLIHVAYSLPYSGNASIEQVFDYPVVGRVDILLGNTDLQLTADGLNDLGTMSTSSGNLKNYGGDVNLPAGSTIRYGVSGVPTSSAAASAQPSASPIAYVLIGAGVGALLIAGGLAIRERRGAGKNVTVGSLLEAIASLDAQHKAGKLDEHAYTRQRAALKAQLTVLMNAQGQH